MNTDSTSQSTKKPRGHALTPWKPGQSGNPGGRAKKTDEDRDVIALCKAKTLDALTVITEIMMHGENERNRLAAALAILERGWGKPMQTTEDKHSGTIEIVWGVEQSVIDTDVTDVTDIAVQHDEL